jgi:cytochrome oxidase Cu insertion factor (SCO1/SenC/PrrC family)
MKLMRRVVMMMLMLVVLVACAPAASSVPAAPTEPAATTEPAAATVPSESASADTPTADASAAQPAAPAWLSLPLVNARTGETFTLADFSGKTVLARSMALWCTNCRRGQMRWRDEVMPQVNMENVVFVSLTIETNLTPQDVQAYADENNFGWIFAVATPELLQALTAQFGNGVNVPPSEPQWMIRPNGSVVGLISDNSTASLSALINSAAS